MSQICKFITSKKMKKVSEFPELEYKIRLSYKEFVIFFESIVYKTRLKQNYFNKTINYKKYIY